MGTKQRKTTTKTTTAPKKRVARKAPARKAAAAPKGRVEQNGVKRPAPGGACAAVWDACDAFLKANDRSPTAQEMRDMAAEKGWNTNNGLCELYQWRKHQGIAGRVTATA